MRTGAAKGAGSGRFRPALLADPWLSFLRVKTALQFSL